MQTGPLFAGGLLRGDLGARLSVPSDDRRSGPVELPGKTSADHAFVQPVTLGERREHDRLVAERSKIGVPILDPPDEVVRESPVDTGADGPAGPGVRMVGKYPR